MFKSYLRIAKKPCSIDQRFLSDLHLQPQLSSHRKFEGRAKLRIRRGMPPKKRSSSESDGLGPLLGRFGTSLKCGIVGLPNVG